MVKNLNLNDEFNKELINEAQNTEVEYDKYVQSEKNTEEN